MGKPHEIQEASSLRREPPISVSAAAFCYLFFPRGIQALVLNRRTPVTRIPEFPPKTLLVTKVHSRSTAPI